MASFIVILQFQTIFPCYMKDVGSIAPYGTSNGIAMAVLVSHKSRTYVIERPFSLTLIINDMKRIYQKVYKSKKPSLGSKLAPGPATSELTLITSTTDLMPFIPATTYTSDTTTSALSLASV